MFIKKKKTIQKHQKQQQKTPHPSNQKTHIHTAIKPFLMLPEYAGEVGFALLF